MQTISSTTSELRLALFALRKELAIAGLLSLGINLLLLTPTLYMLQVYDRVLASRNELTLLAVSLIALALFTLMALAEWLRSRVLIGTGVRLDRALGSRLFQAGLASNLIARRDLGPQPQADLIHLRQFITGSGALAMFDAPWTPLYIAVLWVLHPGLGMMALVFAAVQCLLATLGHRRTVEPAETAARSANAETNFLHRKLHSAEAIESMGMLGGLWERHRRHRHRHYLDEARLQALTHRLTAISKFVRYSQQSLALALGAWLVIEGQLSVGAMIAANVLMTRALAPIDLLAGSWRGFIMASHALARLDALLIAHPSRPAQADTSIGPMRGEVLLRCIDACAPNDGPPILRDIDLQLLPGSVTAIVGPSGSGKSTLAKLVVGAWTPSAGEASIDSRPIHEWPSLERAAHVGFLPQEVALFDGSVADNIARFGDVDTDRVIAAARSVDLHETILRLPRGYDTVVGSGGMTLSGGLQQRIALARAIHGQPQLVVLDEPNANLDDAGEAALESLVRALRLQGATVLLVTHRPAILAAADRLVVLKGGRIERDGTPEAILADVRRPFITPVASPLGAMPLAT